MTAFEHVILLLSFVYALALTHLLSCMAALIRAGSQVRFSWFLSAWMLNALIVILANWLSFFDLRSAPGWNIATILFVLAIAIANYLQAALVCMHVPEEGAVDMVAFHEAQARKYILAFIASLIIALLANIFLGGAFHIGEWISQNTAVIPMFVLATIAAIWIRGRLQALALIGLAGLWIYYFVDLQPALK
jgi:hypothetical protein